MRIFLIQGASVTESAVLPPALPPTGFVWIACERDEFEQRLSDIQAALSRLANAQLVDLHVRDLLNQHLPSHFDYTSQYDLMVFRRLAALAPGRSGADVATNGDAAAPTPPISVLRQIETSPVGFAVFDRVLLSVHPADCAVRDTYAARMLASASAEARAAGVRIAAGPADLMLRVVNTMVDGFLELRRELTRQLDHWQAELLKPRGRFTDWSTMLQARLALHDLDQICDDQRAAVQAFIDMVETWPRAETPAGQRDNELLMVRSRDVLEHIERVVNHVRRLEQSAETTVQMHFSVQSNRTNDIMRVLTVLTAVFLPLNLIAGIFGMNFESIPLLHKADGFWIAMGAMALIALALIIFFWRKRYLERSSGG